ncbi:MAG: TatD family hydrolase [Crocinitomicaceae bacterium]
MTFIDTHTHLYSKEFDEDRTKAINSAIELGVSKFFLPNIDQESIPGMLALQKEFPNQCYPMLGLHPCSVGENYKKDLLAIQALIPKTKIIAVGEIGMDLFWDKSFQAAQKDAFIEQIQWAKTLKLPIVIHVRDAFDETFEVIDQLNDESLTGVFHCFTGDIDQANKIINYGGFKLGIGGVLTFKNSGLDKVIENVELKHLVLETDSPYLAPTPNRGKRNESAYIPIIANKLSDIFGKNLNEIGKITSQNALEVFQLT